jgi:predicted fused transcriptional regulator/phosphomethylpyrimidine kinase
MRFFFDMNSPEQERRDVVLRLTESVKILSESTDIRFIPSCGGNIAYAIRGARDGSDVAAVQGGIIVHEGKIHPTGPCAFGTGERISRIVLTAMKFDPSMRSAAVIGYSKEALEVLADMFIECCSLDPTIVPEGTGTMDWGIASCCAEGVPEVIYDQGTRSRKGLLYIFGEDAVEVANNIIILSHRIQ